MYKLKSSITEELYNQLLSSSNNPELFSSIFETIQDNQTKTDIISIGVLSKNQFTTYIANGTAGGSLTANDANVWHHALNKNYDSVYCGSGTVTRSFYFYHELVMDNYNNFFRLNDKTQYFIWIAVDVYTQHAGNYNPGQYYYHKEVGRNSNAFATFIYVNTNDKQKTVTQENINQNILGNGGTRMNVCQYINICFRPVFKYVDNKKSENIFG